jgi:hypothetical protein
LNRSEGFSMAELTRTCISSTATTRSQGCCADAEPRGGRIAARSIGQRQDGCSVRWPVSKYRTKVRSRSATRSFSSANGIDIPAEGRPDSSSNRTRYGRTRRCRQRRVPQAAQDRRSDVKKRHRCARATFAGASAERFPHQLSGGNSSASR